jgi:hypothetical protein
MTAAFGEVTYDGGQPDAGSATSHGANGAATQAEVIDLNDPRLMSEQLTENPQGDAYAIPPPLPDGKWRVKLSQKDIKDSKGNLQRSAAFCYAKMNDGKPFLATNMECKILDSTGKYDGTTLTEYWVKTVIERSGNSQVGTILAKLKQPLAPASPGNRMDQFLKVLASEPELVAETAWEAQCMACSESAKKKGERAPKPFMLGMHRFAQLRAGGHDPVTSCPVCKSQVRAQARIVQFWPLDTPHNK